MSYYPSRRQVPPPPVDGRPFDYPGDRAFVAEWLAHVEAGRIGSKLEATEEQRAVHAANQLLICGDGRLPIW